MIFALKIKCAYFSLCEKLWFSICPFKSFIGFLQLGSHECSFRLFCFRKASSLKACLVSTCFAPGYWAVHKHAIAI